MFGASVSLRSFCRLGASLAVLGFAHIGASLSIRGLAKFGSDIQAIGKLEFTNSRNYIKEDFSNPTSTAMKFWVASPSPTGSALAMSITSAGGTLHGTWQADQSVTVSDRKLKQNIKPLQETLRQSYADRSPQQVLEKKVAPARIASRKGSTPAEWVLRQLRPVSYSVKQGIDSKNVRFGFIADELERVLPQVVRELPEKGTPDGVSSADKPEPRKGVVYDDLIAVLTSVVKDFSEQLKFLQGRMSTAEKELADLDERDPMDDFETTV
jgi:hypothetical protein